MIEFLRVPLVQISLSMLILMAIGMSLVIYFYGDPQPQHDNLLWQNATVIAMGGGDFGYVVLIESEDGERYRKTCRLCMTGDVLQVKILNGRMEIQR